MMKGLCLKDEKIVGLIERDCWALIMVRQKAGLRLFFRFDSEAFILNSHLQCVNLQTIVPILAHTNNL